MNAYVALFLLWIMVMAVYFYGVHIGRKVERKVQEELRESDAEQMKLLRAQHTTQLYTPPPEQTFMRD